MYEFEITNAALKILKSMDIQPAESVAISCDSCSDQKIVDAFCKACVALDAKPLMLKMPATDIPVKALIATVRGCEAWVELNSTKLNGTEVYDKIMDGKSIKYTCLYGATVESLVKG